MTNQRFSRHGQLDNPLGFSQSSACGHLSLHDRKTSAVHHLEEFPAGDTMFAPGQRDGRLSNPLGIGLWRIHRERSLKQINIQFFLFPANTNCGRNVIQQIIDTNHQCQLIPQSPTEATCQFDDVVQQRHHGFDFKGEIPPALPVVPQGRSAVCTSARRPKCLKRACNTA